MPIADAGMETVAAADATFHTALLARGYRLVTGNHYEAPSGNDTPLSGDLLVPGTGGHRLERIEYARVRLRRHPHLTLALASDSGAGAGPRPQSPGRPGLGLGAPAILIREEPPTSHAVRNPLCMRGSQCVHALRPSATTGGCVVQDPGAYAVTLSCLLQLTTGIA
ncbi:hypothetical protein [Rhodococcus sp. SJ-2]